MLFMFVLGGQTDNKTSFAAKNGANLQRILEICKKNCTFA